MSGISPERVAELERLLANDEKTETWVGEANRENHRSRMCEWLRRYGPALLAERERLRAKVEGFVGVLRSNQDTLLHKVPRTEAVRLQLEVNLAAIGAALEGAPDD
jgi:hypothetical protein